MRIDTTMSLHSREGEMLLVQHVHCTNTVGEPPP
jgi:hypothetical protein